MKFPLRRYKLLFPRDRSLIKYSKYQVDLEDREECLSRK